MNELTCSNLRFDKSEDVLKINALTKVWLIVLGHFLRYCLFYWMKIANCLPRKVSHPSVSIIFNIFLVILNCSVLVNHSHSECILGRTTSCIFYSWMKYLRKHLKGDWLTQTEKYICIQIFHKSLFHCQNVCTCVRPCIFIWCEKVMH